MSRRNLSFADQVQNRARGLWIWAQGPGRVRASVLASRAAYQVRSNLSRKRVLSFPHLCVVFWLLILLWGERWVFDSKVSHCDWDHWESWPKGANPHHLVFVADPQITDPHSYPGRPWPLSSLTVTILDNYLLRSYRALQTQLSPDSVFFLGDLFDGGREWKTDRGEFVDPALGRQRSGDEKKWVDTWHRKYGEDYWLREYKRFGDIFFDSFPAGGDKPGLWQRGRKLVASLPGNHDLGFGAQIQVPVRDRFEAFFGDVNRVDVVGNHTIVSVDSVSLSADTSDYVGSHDLKPIFGPVNKFLENVKTTKATAVQEELSVWYGLEQDRLGHQVQELKDADLSSFSHQVPNAEFPTILLTHVPLYREPGTPCGPYREHWPPAKPPKGQKEPVKPDHRNAISVSGGYQYQNVLSAADSSKLVNSVGNLVGVFSGDDHDYCEIVHAEARGGVREITVKSLSMAMGVSSPGFVMVSLWNPVDEKGQPLPGAEGPTLQTHLCLLPNQIHTYMKYVGFIVFTLVLLAVRSFLVPVLNLTPFALGTEPSTSTRTLLPISSKEKLDPPDLRSPSPSFPRLSASSSSARARDTSLTANGRWQSSKRGYRASPRITLDEAYGYFDKTKDTRAQRTVGVVGREMWTGTWRVAWMVVLFWLWLAREK